MGVWEGGGWRLEDGGWHADDTPCLPAGRDEADGQGFFKAAFSRKGRVRRGTK